MFNVNVNSCGEFKSPISDKKLNTCYTSNGKTYPLCRGKFGNCECKDCNVYESAISIIEGGF